MKTDPPLTALRVPEWACRAGSSDKTFTDWLRHLLAHRSAFGITRVGSVTGLDRVGIPVVQVARPLALSNAVSQGKGADVAAALASGLMESIETWAAERIPEGRLRQAPFSAQEPGIVSLFAPWTGADAPGGWRDLTLPWIEGWDLMAERVVPVPAALVDTVYTLPSPHPHLFPRTTTGLGAGRTSAAALVQAGLEILERDAVAEARRAPRFFDLRQTDPAPLLAGPGARLLERARAAGLLCAFWQAPAAHGLPVYWCHVMEQGPPRELMPLPGEGFGCDATHARAMEKALLEACQSRLTAISGAREDITRRHYPGAHDRALLAEWREQLSRPPRLRLVADEAVPADGSDTVRLGAVLEALRRAGARAAIAVPLLDDPALEVHVVRLLAPPLRLNPRA